MLRARDRQVKRGPAHVSIARSEEALTIPSSSNGDPGISLEKHHQRLESDGVRSTERFQGARARRSFPRNGGAVSLALRCLPIRNLTGFCRLPGSLRRTLTAQHGDRRASSCARAASEGFESRRARHPGQIAEWVLLSDQLRFPKVRPAKRHSKIRLPMRQSRPLAPTHRPARSRCPSYDGRPPFVAARCPRRSSREVGSVGDLLPPVRAVSYRPIREAFGTQSASFIRRALLRNVPLGTLGIVGNSGRQELASPSP